MGCGGRKSSQPSSVRKPIGCAARPWESERAADRDAPRWVAPTEGPPTAGAPFEGRVEDLEVRREVASWKEITVFELLFSGYSPGSGIIRTIIAVVKIQNWFNFDHAYDNFYIVFN